MSSSCLKICVWMNMPSHHQGDFFIALHKHSQVNLVVRYYEEVSEERKQLGWSETNDFLSFEKKIIGKANQALLNVKDWPERIHIVPGISNSFVKELINHLIKNHANWIHWSEMSGVSLAGLFSYNQTLTNFFKPLFLLLKGYNSYAKKINRYALGAFAQGILGEVDFLKWGISQKKISHLFYVVNGRSIAFNTKSNSTIYDKKIHFCYAGTLCKRKGISCLLKAFALLNKTNKSKLILVGNDKSNGFYRRMASKLGIEELTSFIGGVRADQVQYYISSAHVFILPTLFDGWGVVLNEAASLSKPLISTDQCGAAFHLIVNQENGFRVKAGSITELTKAMRFYLDNPEQIQNHGKKSLEIFQEFTPEKNVERLISAINRWKSNEVYN